MAVPNSPSSALQPVICHWGVVVRDFTRQQHLEYDKDYVDTLRYLSIGMWVRLGPERAPEGVDDAGWVWARIRSSLEDDEVTFGWIHPQIFLQLQ